MHAKEDVAIFWDYESARPSSTITGYDVAKNIVSASHEFGIVKSFKAYLSIDPLSKSPGPLSLRSQLQASGVSLIDCPRNDRGEVCIGMTMVDMVLHAIDHPAPCTILLITANSDFAYVISILRMRKYRVILVSPPGAHPSLTSQASVNLNWIEEALGFDGVESTSGDGDRYHSKPFTPQSGADPGAGASAPKRQEAANNRSEVLPKTHHSTVFSGAGSNVATSSFFGDTPASLKTSRTVELNFEGKESLSLPVSKTHTSLHTSLSPVQHSSHALFHTNAEPARKPSVDIDTGVKGKQKEHSLSGPPEETAPLFSSFTEPTGLSGFFPVDYAPFDFLSDIHRASEEVIEHGSESSISVSSTLTSPHSPRASGFSAVSQMATSTAPTSSIPLADFDKDKLTPLSTSGMSVSALIPVVRTSSTATSTSKATVKPDTPVPVSMHAPTPTNQAGTSSPRPTTTTAPLKVAEPSAPSTSTAHLPTASSSNAPKAAPSAKTLPKVSNAPKAAPSAKTLPKVSNAPKAAPSAKTLPKVSNAPKAAPSAKTLPKVVPLEFVTLVKALIQHRARGQTQPDRSVIATEIKKLDGRAYEKAKTTGFRQYAAKAEKVGIVILGHDELGQAWIALRPEWHSAVFGAA